MRNANPSVVRARPLLEAELGDELVALDVEGGLCFGFNDVATAIWRRIEQPVPVDDLVQSLTQEYDVSHEECARDVGEMLARMEKLRLVRMI